MAHKVGAKGQVVIPKEMRERIGLHPGVEVDFALDGERVVVTRRRGTVPLGGRFVGSGMSARLLADRAREPS
jgi:AbrB family looped-hinge helix DNA binding protein